MCSKGLKSTFSETTVLYKSTDYSISPKDSISWLVLNLDKDSISRRLKKDVLVPVHDN